MWTERSKDSAELTTAASSQYENTAGLKRCGTVRLWQDYRLRHLAVEIDVFLECIVRTEVDLTMEKASPGFKR